MASSGQKTKRPGRMKRLLERIILGMVMSICAFLVERRLRKALKMSGSKRRSRTTVRVG